MSQQVQLVNSARKVVATAVVDDQGSHYPGTVDVSVMPDALRREFEEYERLVHDQVFSLLDQAKHRIERTPLVAVFDDGHESCATDVQVYPSAGTISFKAARERVRVGER